MSKRYTWEFPLPRTHTGMLLGNGTLGAMIWGEGGVLRVTIGRADYWDHRGGIHWNEEMSYAKIKSCLEQNDMQELGRLFGAVDCPAGEPKFPSILPIGRLEIDFGPKACLESGTLHLDRGFAEVRVRVGKTTHTICLTLDMQAPVIAIELPKELDTPVIRPVTAWEYVGDYLQSISFTPPQLLDDLAIAGWVQQRPADPPLCVGYRHEGRELLITAVYGNNAEHARLAALDAVEEAGDFRAIRARTRAWWKCYSRETPAVKIPNDRLQFLYDYGMYKFAGLTNPCGVPATLQGPWIEEYQMPPWSSDYHFNINVQMCYWPAFHGNRLEHLRPLFDMVHGWTETLRHNARVFLQLEDGRMLPHAVDDRCTCIGGFWAGSLDHGCTAWVAQMMYRYYRYTMDAEFLRDIAYPFMAGAMRVYLGMLERDCDTFSLPLSVSPEYLTKVGRVPWGKNASFQLACIHRLSADLQEAAAALEETPDPQWAEISEKLPRACRIIDGGNDETIAIWEGVPLEESHRHHSHLAGITPFDIFALDDPEWKPLIAASLDRWIYHGPGLWSGWCVPWAAMIHTRMGQGAASELLLESWQRVFTNEGHGTLHDGHIPGFTLFGPAYTRLNSFADRRAEVMQMDAGMSATAAIQEMLLHTRQGITYLFAGAPASWKKVSFDSIRTDGAFLLSAERLGGKVISVKVESLAGGTLKLANPWDAQVEVKGKNGEVASIGGKVLEITIAKGEKVILVKSEG